MRAKLAALGMSMIVVVALVVEGMAMPFFNQGINNESSIIMSLAVATGIQDATQNANTSPRRGRRGSRRTRNANTGDATEATPAPTETPAATEQATPPATGTMTRRSGQRRGGRRGGRRMMMSGVPTGVEACLNHLAQMAASDPLIAYEGHPSEIINNGLLWNDPKSKCAVTDAAQRTKVFELANAWRMKDATKVRSLLSELGATGTTGSR